MTNKHPLHHKALGFKHVKPKMRFVVFSRQSGIWLRGTFISLPFTIKSGETDVWMAKCKLDDGSTKDFYLEDIGIVKTACGWNGLHFTVHPDFVHLLPEPDGKLQPHSVDDDGHIIHTTVTTKRGRWYHEVGW